MGKLRAVKIFRDKVSGTQLLCAHVEEGVVRKTLVPVPKGESIRQVLKERYPDPPASVDR